MKLTTLKLIEIMARVPLFKSLTPYERERVLKADCKFESAPTHKTFIKEGSQDPFFYIVLAGSAEVKHNNHIVASIKAGDFIGEVGFFCQEPRTASVTATSNMLMMKINKQSFKTLPGSVRESIKDKIIAGLVNRLNRQNDQIIELQSDIDLANCAVA